MFKLILKCRHELFVLLFLLGEFALEFHAELLIVVELQFEALDLGADVLEGLVWGGEIVRARGVGGAGWTVGKLGWPVAWAVADLVLLLLLGALFEGDGVHRVAVAWFGLDNLLECAFDLKCLVRTSIQHSFPELPEFVDTRLLQLIVAVDEIIISQFKSFEFLFLEHLVLIGDVGFFDEFTLQSIDLVFVELQKIENLFHLTNPSKLLLAWWLFAHKLIDFGLLLLE